MKIKKLGHCCLVVEHNGKKIMTDPGGWTEGADTVTGLSAVLITHEHSDHLHIPSIKIITENNPGIRIITNEAVGALLKKEGIEYQSVADGETLDIEGISVQGFGHQHAEIYDLLLPRVENTGFYIGGKLYYPGDCFFLPDVNVDVLALPVCGPWMHIKECIDFAKAVKPRVCFPVHDGMLKHTGPFHGVPQKVLAEAGIEFFPMSAGDEKEF